MSLNRKIKSKEQEEELLQAEGITRNAAAAAAGHSPALFHLLLLVLPTITWSLQCTKICFPGEMLRNKLMFWSGNELMFGL